VLPIIVHQSVQLVKFIAVLGLTLKPAALQHVTNIADELVVASERRKKTLSALNRQQVEPPTDEYAVADCFRQSPWQAADVRQAVLVFLVKFALELARRLKLDHLIWISFDDSLCEKDPNTQQLEAVDWHHDHNARAKRQASYKKGSVYVLCRIQIGFIQFTINWRLYLREKTVRQINKGRARAERVQYVGKTDLALQMLAELQALLPTFPSMSACWFPYGTLGTSRPPTFSALTCLWRSARFWLGTVTAGLAKSTIGISKCNWAWPTTRCRNSKGFCVGMPWCS
jgi:hypothetical protein